MKSLLNKRLRGGEEMLERRFIISIGSIAGLILVTHFGEFFLNAFVTFLMGGGVVGTDIALPSLVMLAGSLLALLWVGWWSVRQVLARSQRTQQKLAPSNN